MSERRWTEEQRCAFETTDKTLLVSAAAGSGKTATLTERVIRQITDPDHPLELSSLLVVTFTKTAAREVRDRIAAALKQAAGERPEDERLERQLLTVQTAKIQTIDSFCADLLKQAGDAVGVAPNARIIEEAEEALLADEVMNDLIDALYDGELPQVATVEAFDELTDSLTPPQHTENLAQALLSLYKKTNGQVDGVRSIRRLVAEYDPARYTTMGQTRIGQYLHAEIRDFLSHAIAEYDACLRALSANGDPSGSDAKMAAFLANERDSFCALADCRDFGSLCDYPRMGVRFEKIPSKNAKGGDSDAFLTAAETRDEIKKQFIALSGRFCLWGEQEWREHYAAMFRLGTTLANVMEKFDALYAEEKRRLGVLTFSDTEHYAYACLYNEAGERTPFAKSLAANISSVYIDEYQDVNELQDRILSAVSRADNRFMVGDIKQCIFCFRGAEPDIFAGMKKTFPSPAEARQRGEAEAAVFMSRNFRSDLPILDFVNSIFDRVFPLASPMLGYTEQDRLCCGKDVGQGRDNLPVIHLLPLPQKSRNGQTESEDEDGGEEEDIIGKELSAQAMEAHAIAELIVSLLKDGKKDDGTPIEAKDVAVLLRKNTMRKAIEDALAARNISCEADTGGDFFLTAEVLLALSLLAAIDNPHRDVYLAGLLCSPLFSFSADEMLRLRRKKDAKESSGETLYASLLRAAENPEEAGGDLSKKAQLALSKLARYRKMAEGTRTDLLLSRLFRETGLTALVAKNGNTDRLRLLCHYAREYEENGYRGLSSFLSLLHRVIENNGKIGSEKNEGSEANAVHILTIHKAKGLEYPVCILADAGSSFVDRDRNNPIYFDADFAISMRERSPGGYALLESAAHRAVAEYHKNKQYEEELRILYVALTRPREQLHIFGRIRTNDDLTEKINAFRARRDRLTPYRARHMASFLDLLLLADPALYRLAVKDAPQREENALAETERIPEKESGQIHADAEETYRTLIGRFRYRYPDPILTQLPQKLSVSLLSPKILDEETGEEKIALTIEEYSNAGAKNKEFSEQKEKFYLHFTNIEPRFCSEKDPDESAKRGIATHMFLQFFDLDSLHERRAAAECERLVREGYLTKEDAARVRMNEIGAFERSRLFSEMRRAKALWREFRFHVELPASLFTKDAARAAQLADRTLLVQGVVDCVIEDEHGALCLIDYKTDRLPAYALADKTAAQTILSERHAPQLSYYALAIERIFGRRPARVEVYSLPLGDTVPIRLQF